MNININFTPLEEDCFAEAFKKRKMDAAEYAQFAITEQMKRDASILLPGEKVKATFFHCSLHGDMSDNAIALLKLQNNITKYPHYLWDYWLEEDNVYVIANPNYSKDIKNFLNTIHRGMLLETKTIGFILKVFKEEEIEVIHCGKRYFHKI